MFKKLYFAISRSSTSTNSKDEVICNSSLQLKIVNFSIVISSSILDVGRVPGPASYKYWISLNSCKVSHFTYSSSIQRLFEDIIYYSVWEKTRFEK